MSSGGGVVRKLRPLFDRVLVERVAKETRSKGGIMLPEKSVGKVLEATVVACGPGKRDEKGSVIPLSVKLGDRVLLPEFGGTKVQLEEGGRDYHLFRDTEILATFHPTEADDS
ncbi:10 kDa heat shock protein, mitochondrial-like isoform X2 [Symsagittifera roscoffensis]|uniref:10 kDa heat shock protein, mitochondrial-like isoform X2 n=1 Tax=Symsagittifera roscoffensis TaxID=84072 RepID=UPI00307C3FA1